MTNTQDNLFDQVLDGRCLLNAYVRARRGLDSKTEANQFAARLEEHVFDLKHRLKAGQYHFGPYRHFKVRDPKERLIHVAPFADRVVHHAINTVISPIFESTFIADSYACRTGKGNARALKKLQHWLDGDPDAYVLTLDVKKFFASVDRHILLERMQKYVSDERLFCLISRLIHSAPSEDDDRRGLPIGNLTSQTAANIYMNTVDHFIKDYLGVKRYLRYVDDLVCVGHKKDLHEWRYCIVGFLKEELHLTIDPSKDRVLAAKNGVTFLGFVLKPNRRPRLKRAAVQRFKSRILLAHQLGTPAPDIARSVASWYGYARLADVRQVLNQANALEYLSAHKDFDDGAAADYKQSKGCEP